MIRPEVVAFESTGDSAAFAGLIGKNTTDTLGAVKKTPESVADPKAKPIWEVFQEIWKKVPDRELRKLPTDLAEQHDHYLYGTPKKKRP